MKSEKVFSKECRLRTQQDYQYMRDHGAKSVGRYFVLITAVPADDRKRAFATVISRRFDKKAVVRNRARRLFRESYRLLLPRFNKSIWLLLIPRWRIKDVKMQEVHAELQKLLLSQQLLNDEVV